MNYDVCDNGSYLQNAKTAVNVEDNKNNRGFNGGNEYVGDTGEEIL